MICLSECQTIASKCAKFNAQSNRILCLIGLLTDISVGVSVDISVDILAKSHSSLGQVSGKCQVSVGRASVEYQSIYRPSDGPIGNVADS